MARYLLEVSYDGSAYAGWQKQPGQVTIQGSIDDALTLIFRQDVATMGSGRTDTGVHAIQQFAHFDLPNDIVVDAKRVLHSLRGILPHDILVKDIRSVSDTFHARFDAVSRSYLYYFGTRPDVFTDRYTWVILESLNIDVMKSLCPVFVGKHDFTTFGKHNPDLNNAVCDVFNCGIKEAGDGRYAFHIEANRFLHHMVRSLVGTLVQAGTGKLSLEEIEDMIQFPERLKCKVSAPSKGLFLSTVRYQKV